MQFLVIKVILETKKSPCVCTSVPISKNVLLARSQIKTRKVKQMTRNHPQALTLS